MTPGKRLKKFIKIHETVLGSCIKNFVQISRFFVLRRSIRWTHAHLFTVKRESIRSGIQNISGYPGTHFCFSKWVHLLIFWLATTIDTDCCWNLLSVSWHDFAFLFFSCWEIIFMLESTTQFWIYWRSWCTLISRCWVFWPDDKYLLKNKKKTANQERLDKKIKLFVICLILVLNICFIGTLHKSNFDFISYCFFWEVAYLFSLFIYLSLHSRKEVWTFWCRKWQEFLY